VPAPSSFDFDRELTALLPRLRLQALALTHKRSDADDLVQDAVRNALAARDRFTPGTDLAAWLYRILRNRFISIVRRAREATGREEDIAATARSGRGAQEDALVLGELRDALGRLPAEQRVALVAVVVQGMSYHALAAATGCAVGTAQEPGVQGAQHPARRAARAGCGTAAPRTAVSVRATPPPLGDMTLFGGGGTG
jgi:RNA polymerase sigma-70 factor, ECF subfamily